MTASARPGRMLNLSTPDVRTTAVLRALGPKPLKSFEPASHQLTTALGTRRSRTLRAIFDLVKTRDLILDWCAQEENCISRPVSVSQIEIIPSW